MCKFVDYLVPTDVHTNIIADITKRIERFERKPLPYDNNYNQVEFLRCQCNCGSVVSSRYDEEHDMPYDRPISNDEYEDYKLTKAFITGVLKHCDHMKIYSYWSDLDE